ncbi:hypothetical protein [Microcystis sp. M42BS1]|uniref:hypothetical protein n=1 Tax=Microcystis sp. M42BS1 TaxID=2771192 RepID=UPI00258E2C1A|nr:hypothetical protein [Microcystis sp. M42BS1]MCA2570683.1 hypothetical protein [Microcystis sp. M42BS1]
MADKYIPHLNKKQNLVALAFYKRKLVSVGFNSYVKTHPKMVNNIQPERIYLHAEVDAIVKAKHVDTLVVIRKTKHGLASAKPCPVCEMVIRNKGIKNVIHS